MTSDVQSFASSRPQAGSALNTFSLETTARPEAIDEAIRSQLARGTSVYITALPGASPEHVVAAAARLRRAGLRPVPHLAARHFESLNCLERLLEKLTAKADVDQVLLIGGDIDRANGPFACALDVLRSEILIRHGVHHVGLAGYPEGHPRISIDALREALATKIIVARGLGLAVHVVTQFCFSAPPISNWLGQFWARFPGLPVHVGLAGPAAVTTLLKYAATCGIGASVRALRRNIGIGKLLTEAGPSTIIRDLIQDEATASRIAQFHFFTFGGIHRTSEFVRKFVNTDT